MSSVISIALEAKPTSRTHQCFLLDIGLYDVIHKVCPILLVNRGLIHPLASSSSSSYPLRVWLDRPSPSVSLLVPILLLLTLTSFFPLLYRIGYFLATGNATPIFVLAIWKRGYNYCRVIANSRFARVIALPEITDSIRDSTLCLNPNSFR